MRDFEDRKPLVDVRGRIAGDHRTTLDQIQHELDIRALALRLLSGRAGPKEPHGLDKLVQRRRAAVCNNPLQVLRLFVEDAILATGAGPPPAFVVRHGVLLRRHLVGLMLATLADGLIANLA